MMNCRNCNFWERLTVFDTMMYEVKICIGKCQNKIFSNKEALKEDLDRYEAHFLRDSDFKPLASGFFTREDFGCIFSKGTISDD